jgi:site-specific DNA-methyltransferase (adenine-specific)
MKTLYYGDNLEILRNKIPDNCIDLCYIDPPFNSKRSYFQIYNNIGGSEDKAQAQAFTDTWTWDTVAEQGYSEITTNFGGRFTRQIIELIKGLELVLKKGDLLAYLVHMTLRVTEIFRVLKPTGSFYLHCDPTASHYLKLVLDAVFCSQGGDYQNEIVWAYRTGGATKTRWSKKHDIIFFYTKSGGFSFNTQTEKAYTKSKYRKPGIIDYGGGNAEFFQDENGVYNLVFARDVWDISYINSQSKERMGYPTQKPEELLERIIKASSNPGDVVLDAYCGCGTTVAVADRLDRQWIGIDITYHSIGLILKRLADANGGQLPADIVVDGIPQDIESARALANRNDDRVRKEFEKWAVLTYTNNRAVINQKKGADQGIDGIVYFATGPGETSRMIIQVKSGGANRGTIATIKGDMQREKAEIATLITMDEPTKPMILEAKSVGVYEHALMGRSYDRIRIVTVREMIEQGARIDLPLSYDAVKPGKKGADDLQIRMDL